MFNLGIQELAVIFIIALLFIGPKQLPELAKSLGKMFRDFKRASNEITDTLQREAKKVDDFKEDLKSEVEFKLLPETDSVSTHSKDEKNLDVKTEDSDDRKKS